MNIREAKQQIKQSVSVYLMKDEFGNYRIPTDKQRPIFLIGAPGIGKTAIIEQIAKELDICLVAYSMTHHTRQSALGLPYIAEKDYQGQTYHVSEYTMSEIIASVYETMEKSGKKEGILFLDEINCVSETLGPSMLQFLQYKIFGNHKVPEGWIVVTAGNPPEYNRSVHEFDVATLDRLRVLEAEPDYEAWKLYAEKRNIHKAIRTYLDIRTEDFYDIGTTVEGKSYVTARGWEDLSEAIMLYEEKGFPVDETLVGQYLANKRIAGEFATYYELYCKYRSDYRIWDILEGRNTAELQKRAKKADFDERITLMGLLLEALIPEVDSNIETETCLQELLVPLRVIRDRMQQKGALSVAEQLEEMMREAGERMNQAEALNGLTIQERRIGQYPASFADELLKRFRLERPAGPEEQFALIRQEFADRVQAMKDESARIGVHLKNLFSFAEKCFGDGNEMLILVTELTVNYSCARFISEHGSEEYFRYNKKFMLYERNRELMREVDAYMKAEELQL